MPIPLLALPAIFDVEEKDLNEAAVKKIFTALNDLIREVIDGRTKEGIALQKDLDQRISVMQKEIDSIEKAAHGVMEKRKAMINEELQSLADNEQEMADIRRQMLYAALDKIDIHEEIIRFKSHLANLLALLKAEGV